MRLEHSLRVRFAADAGNPTEFHFDRSCQHSATWFPSLTKPAYSENHATSAVALAPGMIKYQKWVNPQLTFLVMPC